MFAHALSPSYSLKEWYETVVRHIRLSPCFFLSSAIFGMEDMDQILRLPMSTDRFFFFESLL